MRPLLMLTSEQKLAEIKRLYYQTSRHTIQPDFAKAIDLVKTMSTEAERERAAVFMDGLAQMRSDWAKQHNDGWRKGERGERKAKQRPAGSS
jgi:hypothetical protein